MRLNNHDRDHPLLMELRAEGVLKPADYDAIERRAPHSINSLLDLLAENHHLLSDQLWLSWLVTCHCVPRVGTVEASPEWVARLAVDADLRRDCIEAAAYPAFEYCGTLYVGVVKPGFHDILQRLAATGPWLTAMPVAMTLAEFAALHKLYEELQKQPQS
jgi:hypothetical protein